MVERPTPVRQPNLSKLARGHESASGVSIYPSTGYPSTGFPSSGNTTSLATNNDENELPEPVIEVQSTRMEAPSRTVAVIDTTVRQRRVDSQDVEEVEIALDHEIDLFKIFPLSFRYSIRKTVGWFLMFLGAYGALEYLQQKGLLLSIFKFDPSFVFYGIMAVLGLKLLYWELYRRSMEFRISGFRFIVTRGIIFKTVGSQPIVPFGELYIMAGVFDLICNTRTLHYHTSLDPTKAFLKFEGMSPIQARRLHTFLSTFLSQQIAMPSTEAKATVGVQKIPAKRKRPTRAANYPVTRPGAHGDN